MWPAGFEYHPDFLAPAASADLLNRLWRELEWRRYPITLFGKTHLQPRLVAWCADPGVNYRYSGTRLSAAPWHPGLAQIRQRLESAFGLEFNSVLANAYRDGRDSMGWHADNEPELGSEPVIASVSLGQVRRLLLRAGRKGSSNSYELVDGSLLLMSGRSQIDWQHSVPRTGKVVGLRINLTFRQVMPR